MASSSSPTCRPSAYPLAFRVTKPSAACFELIRSHFPSFTLSNVEIHDLKDGSGLFVEYHSESFIDGTDKVYAQDYVSHLVVENGKIKLLREYLNIISSARALLPKGLADVPRAHHELGPERKPLPSKLGRLAALAPAVERLGIGAFADREIRLR